MFNLVDVIDTLCIGTVLTVALETFVTMRYINLHVPLPFTINCQFDLTNTNFANSRRVFECELLGLSFRHHVNHKGN